MKTANRFPKRPSKFPPVATGTLRWCVKPDCNCQGGILRINATEYGVIQHQDRGRVVGYRLQKLGTNTNYDLERYDDGTICCECHDFLHNRQFAVTADRRACKPSRALSVALPLVGLPLPVPSNWNAESADPNY